jgi:hypothetical protein
LLRYWRLYLAIYDGTVCLAIVDNVYNMTTAIKQPDLTEWQKVPEYIRAILPAGIALRAAHNKAASATGILGIASVGWRPCDKIISVHTDKPISKRVKTAYANTLHADCLVIFTQTPPEPTETVLIKKATFTHTVGDGWAGANKLLGGPTPLSNAIVSGLILSGLGYGTGALAEQLFPERFLERGQLRKPLALAGGLLGLGYGSINANTIRQYRPGTSYLGSWVTSNNAPITVPEKSANMFGQPEPQSYNNLYAPQIPVDAFNRAVWSDASKGYSQAGIVPHTSPAIAAATTGLMTGIATQARSPIISPATVINTIASAGVGLATASIAGRTLGALAGLTPAAQEKIQDTGLWAGMLHAVVPPLFGMR